MQHVVGSLHGFAVDEIWRVALTAAVVFLVPLGLRFGQRHLSSKAGTLNERRERLVIWRNTLVFLGVVVTMGVWGSKIAGFALSLAAVAGAMLIVSKEALMNLLGFINLTLSRHFGLGDYIEIGPSSGRVVDITAMTTTVLETRNGHQVTGATVIVPNALLLTHPVRNLTVTGKFVVHLLRVRLTRNADILQHEQALLEAARMVCALWEEEADQHLAQLEQDRNVDLPSAHTRVLVELLDGKYADLALRYCCRPHERVKVEQEILRHYLAITKRISPAVVPESGQD